MPVRIEPGSEPILGYKLIDRLGGGGFGEVWRAEAPGGLHKAIKVVYGDVQTPDPDGTRRAEQELKALKRVQSVRHPYLLSLERYDIIEGRLLIVMELADSNLWDRFKECRGQGLSGIPRDELLRYMEESAEVLDLMNQQYQLQHLDIKPQNLFLIHNHAKVADFGLVKDLEGMMATVTGGITPVYASPETFDGIVSRFCDQYSLAIVYQELLTGQRPFNGTSIQQLIMQHLNAQPNLTPLPKWDRTAIGRGLAKKPEARYPTCMDLVRALRAAVQAGSAPVIAAGPRPPQAPPAPSASVVPVERSPLAGPAPLRETPPGPGNFALVDSPAGWRSEASMPASEVVEETVPPVQELAPPRPAPPEITGDGVLFPTLLLGLGQKGYEVLQTLREALNERFGSSQALPSVRLLYLDTDAEAVQAATHSAGNPLFKSGETLLARLNRPSHYLKGGGGRGGIESWFNTKLLYRIPRNPVTTGIRALGRLAFLDNYRAIAGRIQAELDTATQPETLTAANKATRLGLRTNRPRVYIIAGLGGGTGSGMFIDAAYVARTQLRQMGYADPEVVGILFVPTPARPPTGRTAGLTPEVAALGNAYAALTELNHFNSPDHTFSSRYEERDSKIKDRDPPFARAILMPMESEGGAARAGESTRLVGDFLYRVLTTKLGRAADTERAKVTPAQPSATGFHTIGLYRFSWPRRTLLDRAWRHLCRELAVRWSTKDADPIKEPVRTWLAEELTRQELDPDHLIEQLQKACEQVLGQPVEEIIAQLVGPFVPSKGRRPGEIDLDAVLEAVGRMEELVGHPEEGGVAGQPILIEEAMRPTSAVLAKEWGEKLAQLSLCLIDQPDYRLAGAEEALRQLATIIEKVLEHHEALAKELAQRAGEAHERIHALVGTLRANPGGGRRTVSVVSDLVEVLKLFPKWRYQSLVLRRMTAIYVSLRGQLSDQLREVNFCRQRLGELLEDFNESSHSRSFDPAPGMCLLPAGCRNVDQAIQQVLNSLTPADVHDLDLQIQDIIEQQFTSLKNICLASQNLLKPLEQVMQQQAEAFAGSRMVGTNVVEMFLSQHPGEENALRDISTGFEDAAPELAGAQAGKETEIRILALPPGAASEQFRSLVQRALPNVPLTHTDSADDIVFYREVPQFNPAELKLLGSAGRDAYRQMNSSEAFPPHSRTDITEWEEIR